jgi:hypothetical protein
MMMAPGICGLHTLYVPLLQNLELTQQLSAEAAKPGNVNVLQGPFLMIGNEPLATLM